MILLLLMGMLLRVWMFRRLGFLALRDAGGLRTEAFEGWRFEILSLAGYGTFLLLSHSPPRSKRFLFLNGLLHSPNDVYDNDSW